jgi:acetyl esterase/lipase
LDLSIPDGDGPFPLVVLIHGGGWRAGEKAHLDEERRILAGRGYAAASVDYRLVPATFPAAVADVRCAVRWLREHAAERRIDPDRVGLVGFSAGAHLAALAGLAPEVDALDEVCDSTAELAVHALVLLFGPSDLRAEAGWPRPTTRIITRFLGTPAAEDPTRAALASPIAWAGPGDPPTLLIHGDADAVVPLDQSIQLRDALAAAGVATTYVEIEGGRHGFPLFSARPDLRAAPCTTLAFLAAHLAP